MAGSASERITFDYDVDSYDLGALESGRKGRGDAVKIPGGEAASIQMEDLMVGDGGSHVTLAARTESVNSNRTETFEDDDEGSLASSDSLPAGGSAGDSSASISTPPAPKDASMVSRSSTKSSEFSSSSELL